MGDATPFSVAVFCGSRPGRDPVFAEIAASLGGMIGERGWRLVYGGGEVGLMGVAARAALDAGGTVLGVIPPRLMDREGGKHDLTQLRVTATMFDRKADLIREADAFVALPGGLGTLDEILDVLTLRQLGYHAKPLLLLDHQRYWRAFEGIVSQFVVAGFADASAAYLYELVGDVPGALTRLDLVADDPARLEPRHQGEMATQQQ